MLPVCTRAVPEAGGRVGYGVAMLGVLVPAGVHGRMSGDRAGLSGREAGVLATLSDSATYLHARRSRLPGKECNKGACR